MKAIIIPKNLRSQLFLLFGTMFSIAASVAYLLIPQVLEWLIDHKRFVTQTIVNLGLLFIMNLLFNFLSSFLLLKYAEHQIKESRYRSVLKLLKTDISFFDNSLSGELSSRIINDTETVRKFLSEVIPNAISSVILILLTFIVLLRLDIGLSTYIFLGLLLMVVFLTPLSAVSRKYAQKKQNQLNNLSGYLTEIFQRVKLIKLNQGYGVIKKQYSQKLFDTSESSFKYSLVDSFIGPIVYVVLFIILSFIFAYGGYRVSEGTLTVGTLIAFLIYLFQLLTPFSNVGQFANQFAKTKQYVSIIDSYRNLPDENKGDLIVNSGNFLLLEFRNVEFSYDDYIVLQNINLKIGKGEKVAFVGPSGSGKTTVINLLLKLYSPVNGEIIVNSNNLEAINTESWRKKISLISQNFELLSGTIYDNLTFGLDKLPDDKTVREALERVNLSHDIEKFEQGLNTPIGEQGLKLSGGQKQRLQLARGFLKNADIFILDEATSNLDSVSESVVLSSIEQTLKEKTVIFVTHKLATIKGVDKIFFIDNGHIIEEGTHEDLLKNHQKYKLFLTKQTDNDRS
ncbi:ABC transporter ATP-binding protein [Streptococcus mutans]|uniref:ABC transporter ATP-binding protein n=1 Tax=Streptococcus mutans TaxID=1309 RepID=UPI0014555C0B|nr:ABC transporter ATP-binding protein [Streptococcus mutans]MCB5034956.1 ABC transporter ATP-binding protein/permease [Streptococcus mutans]NLQ48014.1 ABC transporter ATP-binding protein [Streptococcus mutans]